MKRMQRWTTTLVLALTAGLAGKAWAINPDQITITITPNVAQNIAISTSVVQWFSGDTDLNLTLNLGATDYFVRPATVTYTGTYANAEMDVRGSLSGGWALDTDATSSQNDLQVYVLFGATGQGTAPALTDFVEDYSANGDHVLTTDRRYGLSGSDDGTNDSQYQTASYSSASENLSDNDQRHMWVRLDMPPTTTVTTAQTLNLILTANASN
jgi:hypothetical protein